jgi:hypothetical protein
MTKTILISGKTYSAAIADSQVPAEEGWPEPGMRRVGKGRSYVYVVDERVAKLIEWHLDDVAGGLDGSGDPEARADCRAIRKDLDRMRKDS